MLKANKNNDAHSKIPAKSQVTGRRGVIEQEIVTLNLGKKGPNTKIGAETKIPQPNIIKKK
jgi:hypothetical protein